MKHPTYLALLKAREAMDTWLCTYADDMVGDEAVAAAWARMPYGTLYYISDCDALIDEALTYFNTAEGE